MFDQKGNYIEPTLERYGDPLEVEEVRTIFI